MTIKTVNLPLYWCTKHNQSWSSGRIIKVFGLENCYSPWKNLVKRRTAREGESGDFLLKNGFFILSSTVFSKIVIWSVNPLSANITKWPNIFRQFVVKWPTNCLSVFDHFVVLALKVFKKKKKKWVNQSSYIELNWLQAPAVVLNGLKGDYVKLINFRKVKNLSFCKAEATTGGVL